MDPSQHHNALNRHDRLHWYEIESILGQGGFGITYLARDTNLDQKVAIKEYLPSEFSTRDKENTVQPISENHTEIFDWGKQRFLDEARTLAQFRHPNVVRVSSFFENNNTGYMVMEYEEGTDLGVMIKAGESFDEKRLLNIILPVLDGLALVHEQGFIHRDIKPANIFIRDDGSPVLIDFGSARQAIGGQTKTLTSLVTPGFAPFEQYHDAEGKQGPWTDIYSLGATSYAMLTGKAPIDALKRGMARLEHSTDAYLHLVDLVGDRYPEPLLRAIDCALEFKESERPQSVREWQSMIRGEKPVPQSDIVTRLGEPAPADDANGSTQVVTRPQETASPATQPADAVSAPATEVVATTRPDTAPPAPPPPAQTDTDAGTSGGRRTGPVAAAGVLVLIGLAIAGYLVLAPDRTTAPPAVEIPAPSAAGEAVVEVAPKPAGESTLSTEEARVKAEQQALREQQARIAQEKAQLAEEKAKLAAEQQRQADLARQQAEQKRQQELAQQQAEQKRQQQLAKQQAEQKRQQELAQQQAEQKRQQELAQQQAEQKRQQELAKQQAEKKRQQQAAQQQGGVAAAPVDFSGIYFPDEGFEELELTQTGNRVRGIIGNEGSSLEGTVNGNRLEFTFSYSRTGYGFKQGTGELMISADGSRLEGSRFKGGFARRTPWSLSRKAETTRGAGLLDDLSGTYRPDEGFEDLKLTQTGDKVKGIIGTNGSTLEGTRKGNRITFIFNYSKTGFGFKDGYGQFTVSADGKRLTGTRSRGGFPANSVWNLTRQTNN